MANRVGRIQRGVLPGLVANRARPVSAVALLRWCYPHLHGKFAPKHHQALHHAAPRFGVRIRNGVWTPRASVRALITGQPEPSD